MRFLHRSHGALTLVVLLACATPAFTPLVAAPPAAAKVASTSAAPSSSSGSTDSLEQAAKRAGDTGRKVAMYLIGLAFAFAAVLLVFKRDFREAAAIFGVGILAVLLATPSGLETLRSTVDTLFR
jgi:hypothetical protein